MLKRFMVMATGVILLAGLAGAAEARGRSPCSGKMGGVAYCSGGKFVCKNGKISRSKQTFTRGE